MQFSVLKTRLSTALAQYSTALDNTDTTNFWTDTELKQYLNIAQKEFCLRSRITTKRAYLDVTDEGNTYVLPSDIVEVLDVQYKGIPLDAKNTKYLESAYSGTSHFEQLRGQGRWYRSDWRDLTGTPKHWYMEGLNIHLFPRVTASLSSVLNNSREEYSAVTVSGSTDVKFSQKFPTYNKNVIDIYINGVLQNPNSYTVVTYNDGIADKTKLTFTASFDFVGDVIAIVWNTPVIASRYTATLTAGATSKSFSDVVATDPKYRVSMNGVTISNPTVTLSSNTLTVSWTDAAEAGDILDVVVYDMQNLSSDSSSVNTVADDDVSITYIYAPSDMSADTDVPDLPVAFHDAIWQYAAYLALTREGQHTQDFQKAAVYNDMFEQSVARAIRLVSAPVDVDFAVTQPFFV